MMDDSHLGKLERAPELGTEGRMSSASSMAYYDWCRAFSVNICKVLNWSGGGGDTILNFNHPLVTNIALFIWRTLKAV